MHRQKKKCATVEMIHFIKEHFKYPKTSKEAGIEGIVLVSFVVEADGSISEAKIKQGLDPACDEEALRVVKAMPRWVPGIKDGKAVATEMTLPFNFALPNIDKNNVEVFEAYPNPSNENGFTLKFKAKAGSVQFKVTEVASGQELASIPFDNYDGTLQEAHFDGLFHKNAARGNVIISLLDTEGKVLKNLKVVIH